jgi:hypothetical protein
VDIQYVLIKRLLKSCYREETYLLTRAEGA